MCQGRYHARQLKKGIMTTIDCFTVKESLSYTNFLS